MTPQGSPPGAADAAVVAQARLRATKLHQIGPLLCSCEACQYARCIVRWSDTVAAAVGQEETRRARDATLDDSCSQGVYRADESNAYRNAADATEQAVRAALPRDEKEGG